MADEAQPTAGRSLGCARRREPEFWLDAAGPPGFPRDPEPLIALHLPVAVIALPSLTCAVVAAWVAANDLPAAPPEPDRALRGCLFAYGDDAYLLVDSND